jgi:hypothetical protein
MVDDGKCEARVKNWMLWKVEARMAELYCKYSNERIIVIILGVRLPIRAYIHEMIYHENIRGNFYDITNNSGRFSLAHGASLYQYPTDRDRDMRHEAKMVH